MPAPEPLSIAQALARARAQGIDRLDAQLLLAHRLGRSRTWLLGHDETRLTAADTQALAALYARRAAGEPLAYLVGEREFHGLTLRVTPDVLVPRPDTETLVDWALELLAGPLARLAAPRVVDLGTGSGAIALAIKHACPRADVVATDASVAALAVARDNGARLGLPVTWLVGDWWQALPAMASPPAHLVLANPPYIAAGDAHLSALAHEPYSALVAPGDHGDGLAAIERILAGAANHLCPGAWLLLEHGFEQAEPVCARLHAAGFVATATRADLAGQPRVSAGRWHPEQR
jgi:release factor glutamine methyltransferase